MQSCEQARFDRLYKKRPRTLRLQRLALVHELLMTCICPALLSTSPNDVIRN